MKYVIGIAAAFATLWLILVLVLAQRSVRHQTGGGVALAHRRAGL